ncbi:type 2 lantipeptide synthetase LanM [Mycobacterium simiae]|uniref:Type 2 lantipeptide synthetase LanM n=1 Tax=Mycobacterium simiae TaxID=1784 RepID=A0A5B1BS04_MYCSI|nr:type 2 lanthipeptide synthetase LanM family protein [Mycobacterium simiae]KAA1250190.1 type 2 lantipeptide synthetase LanM [Mycobacterium simiae]
MVLWVVTEPFPVFRAFTLRERLELLRQGVIRDRLSDDQTRAAQAALDSLCNAYLAGNTRLLDLSLSALGTDQQGVLPVLIGTESTTELPSRPRWQVVLEDILATMAVTPASVRAGAHKDLTVFFRPFVRYAAARLDQYIRTVSKTTSARFAIGELNRQFIMSLLERLCLCGLPVIVLEMHKARMLGMIAGSTPEQRFDRFVDANLVSSEWIRETLYRYPTLARMLATITDFEVKAWCDLYSRIAKDFDPLLASGLLSLNSKTLVSVEANRGDRHNNGKAVAVLEFDSGERVIYKPRPMRLAARFQDFMRWLVAEGLDLPSHIIAILDKGEYGWAEFVAPLECTDVGGVNRFYRRQGILLAVLYVLDATDCHSDNVIASGEFPVLIDLETILHNQPNLSTEISFTHALREAVLAQTVLRVAYLPQAFEGSAGIADFSALGSGDADQEGPFLAPQWQGLGTDEMRLVSDLPGILRAGCNLPIVDGNPVSILNHQNDVVEGFELGYRFLLRKRNLLLAPEGPLELFQDCVGRHVVWATQSYTQLTVESCHPSCMDDAVEREFVINDLWERIDRDPHLKPLVDSEKAAIWNLDVPCFHTRIGGRDLWDENGERFENYFAASALDRVRDRIQEMGERDLEIQRYAVKMSLASIDLRGGPGAAHLPPKAVETIDRTQLVAAAQSIGEHLITLMLIVDDEAWWLGLRPIGTDRYAPTVLGTDLYSGSSGIAMFLGWLGHLTGDARFSDAARMAIAPSLRELASATSGFGAFTGSAGALYAASHLAWLWHEPQLLNESVKVFENLKTRLDEDLVFDIVGGVAGNIMIALTMYKVMNDPVALDFARACADHLTAHAEACAHGLAWRTQGLDKSCLYGFAHGSAGIGFALASVGDVTGESHYQEAAMRAFSQESIAYVAERKNWPDLRQCDDREGIEAAGWAWAWCHGAAGIGLARAGLVRDGQHSELRTDIERAVSSVLTYGFGSNACLCHGDLGNAEFLHLAGQALGRADLCETALRVGCTIVDEHTDKRGWPCGIADGLELPGLMCGLAGIGYEFLRLADPQQMPSILLLETPGSFSADY